MMKRAIFKVRFDKKEQAEFQRPWYVLAPSGIIESRHWTQREAVFYGAGSARDEWNFNGVLTQLRVYGKDGRIKFERTYGRDPKRRKG